MQRWIDFLENINERVGRGAAWLSTVLVVLVFLNVFARYVLNEPTAWSKELEWHVFALLFLLAAGYALKHDRHVRVDLFYEKMSAQDQARVNFWGTLLFLLPWCLLVMWTGYRYAYQAYVIDEGSPEANGLANRWLIKFAIPVGMFFLLTQGLALLLRSWRTLRSPDQARES
ncbi:MAG: TRAP transporter small permease subunit [Lewinella sp.]|nr:TRAP transporter small permease subunit [Lewinella sp.]